MASIVTRASKGSALTHTEMDNNFKNVICPSYSSAPSSPSNGEIYYNTTTGIAYVRASNEWRPINNLPVSATGGTTYTSGGYKYHKFTSSGNFVVSRGGDVEYLIVAGGGSGGRYYYGGGGGAGGYLSGALTVTAQTYSIVVGAGGATQTTYAQGNKGSNSTGFGLTAVGGGGGGTYNATGNQGGDGGSGGGGSGYNTGPAGSGTAGQGNDGGRGGNYAGGGGGGAGEAGTNAGNVTAGGGGDGKNDHSTWATATSSGDGGYYAGGGAGSTYSTGPRGYGGLGGGGDGAYYNGSTEIGPVSGSANTGGGGGGQKGMVGSGGASGGSGIVIVRYAV